MNIEKLKRLQSQVRIGGKGTPRRKKKVMHQTAAADDKKLQSSLKKLSVSTIPGIEEVNIIKDDLTVIHFNNPKAQASLSANTFAVTGHGETKKIVEMLPEILPQLGQETVVQLRMFANSMTKNQKEGVHGFESNLLGNTEEDDVPLLVSDFEEIAKKENLNKEQMQRPTKESVLSAEMNSTGETAPMQSTEKYPNSDNKAIDNAGSLIEPLRNEDNNVKSEMEVNNNNPKKSDKSDNVKEGLDKKDHNKPKSDQNETVYSINEPLQASGHNDKKVADVKETVKKNATKTSEKNTAGTNVKEVNNKKESSKPKSKVIEAALSPSQHTKAEPLVEPLHTLDYNVKTEVDAKRDNSKKSEKNNTKKTSVPEKTGIIKDSNVKKEPKNKVTQAVTSSISQQQNEKTIQCNELLPTKELKQDKSLNINADTWSKVPTHLENVTEQKDDQTMISKAKSNAHLLEQTKNYLIEQKTLIESNLTDDTLLFTDSNVRNLETSIKDTHQEKKNEPILSLENNNKDSKVVVSSLSSVLSNEEIKKEKTQEIQYVLVSTNTLEKTIKNVEEIKDTALLDLESPEKKLDLDDTLNDTSKCDVQEVVANSQILNLVTKIKDVQEEQNFVILDDKLCLDEKKGTDSQLIDPAIVFANLPDPLQTNDIKSEEIIANTLIDKEKQIKVVEITQNTAVSSKFIEENPLEREASEKVLQSLHNITTHPDYVEISKDLLKTEGHNLLNTKNIPQNELAKQAIDENIKSEIHIDPVLATKLTLSGSSQKKDVLKKDTGKPQLASPMKPDAKKPDLIVRPKQVSPPKSHTQQSSNTGTTPKTQQTTKSVSGSKSVRQEKSSAAPKAKQTLSTSIKSQATATASKPSTTQAKKTSVSSPSSDLSTKNSVAIKASSAVETAAPVKPRVDNNNQKETKKPKPQTVATSGQKKVMEDPPKSCQ